MALNKLKKFVTEEVMDEVSEDEYYNAEKDVAQNENVKPGKDLLYQKFSTNKDTNKNNIINKNFTARTKGF